IKKIFIEELLHQPKLELCGTSESTILPVEELLFSKPDFVFIDCALYEIEKGILRNLLEELPNITIFMLCDFLNEHEIQMATKALCLGVADCFQKPMELDPIAVQNFKTKLLNKLNTWPINKSSSVNKIKPLENFEFSQKYEIITLFCSTGGFFSLMQILPFLPKNFPIPILINIQLPKVFSKSFLEKINQVSHLYIKEAKDGDTLTPSSVYLIFRNTNLKILNSKPKKSLSITSVTSNEHKTFFRAIVETYGSKAVAVILSGDGFDLTEEMQNFKQQGGLVILQDETTSILWKNAKLIYEFNLFDMILPPEEIVEKLCQLAWV
ncbi:MAG: chemotaxis protein CheB, partial [Candidatus Pacearchaeota archaeon]